jgi:O-methyltransferase
MKLPKLPRPDPKILKNFFLPTFWGASDAGLVARLSELIVERVNAGYHFSDNFLTWGRNNSMLEDDIFVKSWNNNIESESDKAIIWRRYILACAAFHCVQLEGDFVECGCYMGVGVKTIVDYLGGREFPKKFWAYDLFEHLPTMLNHPMPEHSPDLYAKTVRKFADYPQVIVLRGKIPDVFSDGAPDKISYLHIDLNQAPAEIAALDALFDKVVSGGIIVLDDYEWAWYREQKIAEDPWFEVRGYRVMPLPTGQGLVFKR